jgi:hypothetical protein
MRLSVFSASHGIGEVISGPLILFTPSHRAIAEVRSQPAATSLCRPAIFPRLRRVCLALQLLSLCSQRPDEGEGCEVACDGFTTGTSRFVTSQVPFIRMILAFRRKGQSFAVSHMGSILNGELVTRERFSGGSQLILHGALVTRERFSGGS